MFRLYSDPSLKMSTTLSNNLEESNALSPVSAAQLAILKRRTHDIVAQTSMLEDMFEMDGQRRRYARNLQNTLLDILAQMASQYRVNNHNFHIGADAQRTIRSQLAVLTADLKKHQGRDKLSAGLNLTTNTLAATLLTAATGFYLTAGLGFVGIIALPGLAVTVGTIIVGLLSLCMSAVALALTVEAISSIWEDIRFLADDQIDVLTREIDALMRQAAAPRLVVDNGDPANPADREDRDLQRAIAASLGR